MQCRFAIKPRADDWLRGQGIQGLLRGVFFRNLLLVDIAKRLLNEVKERREVPASDWKQLMMKYNLTVSNYESAMQRLRGAGMLRKEKGVWTLSSDFAKYLTTAAELWYDWKGS